jgi:hypothetical protein
LAEPLAGTVRGALGDGWADAFEALAADDDGWGVGVGVGAVDVRAVAFWDVSVCDVGVPDVAVCAGRAGVVGVLDAEACAVDFTAVFNSATTEPPASFVMEPAPFVDFASAVVAAVAALTVATGEVLVTRPRAFTAWPTADRPSLSALADGVAATAPDSADVRLPRVAASELVRF